METAEARQSPLSHQRLPLFRDLQRFSEISPPGFDVGENEIGALPRAPGFDRLSCLGFGPDEVVLRAVGTRLDLVPPGVSPGDGEIRVLERLVATADLHADVRGGG